MSSPESSFRQSPEVLTARLLYQHRMAAPEPFEESDEYAIAIKAWNRSHRPINKLRRHSLVQNFGIFALGMLSGISVLTCSHAEMGKTLLRQGEPHPGHSLVNPDRNG